jgi:hypothetical protein
MAISAHCPLTEWHCGHCTGTIEWELTSVHGAALAAGGQGISAAPRLAITFELTRHPSYYMIYIVTPMCASPALSRQRSHTVGPGGIRTWPGACALGRAIYTGHALPLRSFSAPVAR